jgi:hypothetical protein
MNLKFFLLNLLFFFSTVFAQFPLPEQFLTFPVYIKLARGGTATGFYYSDSTNFYLVTAKHVFFDPNSGKLNSETAELISYPRDPYKNPYNLLKCDLKFLLDRNLVVAHNQFDVAVALIGKQERIDSVNMMLNYNESITKPNPKSSRVNQFSPVYILESKDLLVGTEVYIAGYPTSVK